VPVHIEAGAVVHNCEASRELAKRLATHLFTGELRVIGQGRWHVDGGGNWTLDRFTIRDFERLMDTSLTDAVAALRNVPGSDWDRVSDPWADLNYIRHNIDETD
jgi:hypothetical protein